MSTKGITEQPHDTGTAPKMPEGWETAPSVMREDNAGMARYVGFFGAFLVIFGGISLVANIWYKSARVVGPGWSVFFLTLGLIALLYHAAFDRDLQFRRMYMAFSYAAMIVGVFLCVLPYPHSGDQFQSGYLCLSLSLVFLLAFLRNETDEMVRMVAQRIVGAGGAIIMVVGLVGGNIRPDFLLPIGFELTFLGMVYLAVFVASRGTEDDQAYYAGLGVGLAGALVFLIAFARSFVFKQPGTNYFLPHGLALLSLGTMAVLLSLLLCSESRLVVLTRRELGSFFYTPVAYFVLVSFTAIEAFVFADWAARLLKANDPFPEPIIQGFLLNIPVVVLIIAIVPVLTMRLFSEEWRTGTLEVLLTTPVNEPTVAISKFLAAYLMYLFIWVPFGLFLVALWAIGGTPFDYYPVISFGVAVAVSGAGFISMGLFFSSLTRNQLVSGVLTMAGMILFTCLLFMKGRMLGESKEQVASKGWPLVLQHINYLDLWIGGIVGMMDPKQLIFHLSMTVFFLFLTVKVLESRKWL